MKLRLWIEMTLLFAVLPLVMAVMHVKQGKMLTILWLLVIATIPLCRAASGMTFAQEWNWGAVTWRNMKPVLLRFAPCAVFLIALVVWLNPERLWWLPREKPGLWALVMVLYPVCSVLPQEWLYRTFFFTRYSTLFTHERARVAVNALLFGYVHILFHNWIAVVLCIAGGAVFTLTYRKHRSLALVCIEHALYGCFVFTVGLGFYFFNGR